MKVNHPLEFLILATEQVGQLYKASKVTFYVVDKRFQARMVKRSGKNAERTKDCEITKMILDNQPITGISKDLEHYS